MAESETRSDEQKAQDYSAMLGSVSVITNCLDDSNEFCNDMTSAEKKERVMRSSGYLSFMKDLDDSSMFEDEEQAFEGRYTFPEEKSHETNKFIIRYIKEKFPRCNVGHHGHSPYCHEEKGDKQIYTAGCDVKIILSGLKMGKKTSYRFTSVGETECYWDHDGFGCISYPGEDGMTHNMVLRGGRFEELNEIMKILCS